MTMSGGYAERQPRYIERQSEADATRIRLLEGDMDANDRNHFFLDEKIKNNESRFLAQYSATKEFTETKLQQTKEYVDEQVKTTNLKIDRLTWAFAGACLTFSLAIIIGIVNVITGKL